MDLESKSLKSQMKQADRAGAGNVLIIGSDELQAGRAQLRDMKTGAQDDIDLAGVGEYFQQKYGS